MTDEQIDEIALRLASTLTASGGLRVFARAIEAAERERCAVICDDEARIRTEAAVLFAEFSEERARCNAAARGAINCANGIRSGEVVTLNVKDEAQP